MAALTARRVGMVLAGAALAGVAATVLQAVGVSPVYAVVVGLSGAMPLLLQGMRPAGRSGATGDRIQYAIAEIFGALLVGTFGAFALVLADVSQGVLVTVATLATYVGGFMARAAIGTGAEDVDDE